MTQPDQPTDGRQHNPQGWQGSAPDQPPQGTSQPSPGWYQQSAQAPYPQEPQGYPPPTQYEPIQQYPQTQYPQDQYAQAQYPQDQYPQTQYPQAQYGQQVYGQPQGWTGAMPPAAPQRRPVWKTVVGVILIVIGSLGTLALLSNVGSGRFGTGGQGAAYSIGYLFGTLLVSLVPLALGILLVRSKR